MTKMMIIDQTIFRTEVSETGSASDWVIVALIVAIGAFLRFWGLGNVGLHGDEETTVMPALAVLEQGGPYFPSGMFYGRALAHTYLIAGSVWIFGDSEWALRLPSALVGSIMPLLAFFLGRRFLSPRSNLAFVAIIAFLPGMIDFSQTARMYVFWLAALMLFGSCVFRWERKKSLESLIVAIVAWIIALHFQSLSILAAPLFLFPGLTNRSWSQLVQGAFAIGFCAIAFKIYGDVIDSYYPASSERPIYEMVGDMRLEQSSLQFYWDQYPLLLSFGVTMGLVLLVWSYRELVHREWSLVLAKLLFGFGFIACAILYYHVGVMALLVGSIIWLRVASRPMRSLYAIIGIVGAMATIQASILYQTGEYPGRQLIGAFVGQPSVWPILRFAEYSPVAFGLYLVVLAYSTYKLATRHRIPDHVLFFVISIWAPLVVIGTQTSYPELRYTAGMQPFFLLCCVAGLGYLARQLKLFQRFGAWRRPAGTIAAISLVLLITNPMEVVKVASNDYERHPDHKGAAEFVRNLRLTDDDIVIAEDVLQQTYYLGEVDYWLRSLSDAHIFLVVKDGQNVDIYTSTLSIGSGSELVRVLNENKNNKSIIIGSGEIFPGRDEWARGRDIAEVLQSARLRVVYEGRDGITKVWVDAARAAD